MLSDTHRSEGLLRPRAEPRAGWALLWLPLLVIGWRGFAGLEAAMGRLGGVVPATFEGAPSPGSATVRLAVVLLVGMLVWGMGRGPAGPWVERGFAALLMVAWFAVCGTSFRLHGAPYDMPVRLAVAVALLSGPVLLLWAWRRRARMVPVVNAAGRVAAPGSAAALLWALSLVGLALFALDRLLGLERADLVVVGGGLLLYATFRVRGRHQELGARS